MVRAPVLGVVAAIVVSLLAVPGLAAQQDVIIVFEQHARAGEHIGDIDVAAMKVSPTGKQVWGDGSRATDIASSDTLETSPHAVSDGLGGAIVVYEYETRSGDYEGDKEIAAQRVDASGKLLWGQGEHSVLVATSKWTEANPFVVPDGQGGAIVVFEEHSRGGEYAGDIDVGAQRLSPSGELMWQAGDRSAIVASSENLERNPVAIPDGTGGAIVVFEVEERTGDQAGDTEIFAQRIDAQGKAVWENGERSVMVASSAWAERNPIVVPDGRGGAIIIFERHARGGEYAGDIDVAAQRISPGGELLWNDGESSVQIASAEALERAPSAIPDGLGGAIIVFESEARTGEDAGDSEIGAQRVDAGGKLQWGNGEGYVFVASSSWSERSSIAVSDGQGGVVAVFEQHALSGEYTGDIDIGAQRVSASGELLWNDGDESATVSSSAMLERTPYALADGSGGVLVVFEMEARTGDSAGDADVAAQLISSAGKMVWNDGDKSVLVASSTWSEKSAVIVGK